MNILGLVTKTHDTGAAVLVDGIPRSVIEEERLVRDKHTQFFPFRAVAASLEDSGLTLDDIDVVTTPWNVANLRRTFFNAVTSRLPDSLNLLRPAAHDTQNSGIVFLTQRLSQGLRRGLANGHGHSNGLANGADRAKGVPPIVQVGHHDAHAAAFLISPFEEAAVVVMDGYGDVGATSVYTGRGNRLERHWSSGFFDSIGALYTAATIHLGFKPFEEGTVMALAATGERTLVDKFRPLVRLLDGGSYRLDTDYIGLSTHGLVRPFTRRFIEIFGPPRARHEPLEQRHRDLAYALQATVEDAVLHVVRAARRLTPARNLCLSGGVALNCVANARVLRDTDFERVWVPPCASDTGAPLGSALWHYHHTLGHARKFELTDAFLGRRYTNEQIAAALTAAGLAFERVEEPTLLARTADALSRQKIVGWFQGRFEMGPRALGNRSILSDPRDVRIKEIMNVRVKQREPFRPFAPAVLAERAAEFFEVTQPDPFMTLAPRVRPDKVAAIPAAVHVDGTGRFQTVEREANPRFHALISEFARLTGVPVLLNTSFNRQEPIVASPEDAISCYLRTRIDLLAIGDFLVTDRPPAAVARAEAHHVELQARLSRDRNRWRQALRP